MSSQEQLLLEFMKHTPVKDIVGESRDVVTLSVTDEVGVALKTLSFHEIISAVLVDTHSGEYKGFVDMMDIVSYALFSADCLRLTPNHRDLTQDSQEDLLFKGKLFSSQQIAGIEKTTKFKQLMFVTKDTSLLEVVQRFSQEGQRRAAVIEPITQILFREEGELQKLVTTPNVKLKVDQFKCVNVIAYSDIAMFLNDVALQFPDFLMKTVQQLGFSGKSNLVQVEGEYTSVYQALKMIHDHNITGLAVVNTEGTLTGNFSATDLMPLSEDWDFKYLALHVNDYLKLVHKRRQCPLFCWLNTTLETVLLRMTLKQVHRLYVVSKERKPIDVVSLTDVVHLICKPTG